MDFFYIVVIEDRDVVDYYFQFGGDQEDVGHGFFTWCFMQAPPARDGRADPASRLELSPLPGPA
jgi:hypothetical protein